MRVVAGPLTITIMQQACTTPSGVALPYEAHVLFEGVAYQGCARRGVSEGDRPTWASVLPELIPAIDACLARVSSRPARITTANALDEGQVSVRLRESDGSRRECIADNAAPASASMNRCPISTAASAKAIRNSSAAAKPAARGKLPHSGPSARSRGRTSRLADFAVVLI